MGFKYDKHNKYHRMGRSAVITAISLFVLLWVWWLVSVIVQRTLDLNSSPLATPQDSFAALFELIKNGDPLEHRPLIDWVWSSLSKFIKGFILALVIALPVGLLMGNFKLIREFISRTGFKVHLKSGFCFQPSGDFYRTYIIALTMMCAAFSYKNRIRRSKLLYSFNPL